MGALKGRKVEGLILLCADAGKAQQCWQLLRETLVTVIASGLNTQGTRRVVLFSEAIIEGFVSGLQPDLKTVRVLRRWHFKVGQCRHMIVGQLPSFTTVKIGLGAQITVKHPMRADGRVDQQGFKPMLLGQPRRIVAAERACDQQRAAQLMNGRLQLRDGFTGMMVQGWHP